MDIDVVAEIKNRVPKLQSLIDRGFKFNSKGPNGQTILYNAAKSNDYEIVTCLLDNGADVLIADDKGYSALHIAVANDNNATVNVILENVARDQLKTLLDMKSKVDGNAALHLAAESNNRTNVKSLLEHGANFEITNNARKKPMDLTSREDLRQLFRLINASFAKAKKGDNQLIMDFAHYVAYTNDFTSTLSCRNKDGHTIVQVCILHDHYELEANLMSVRCSQPTGGFVLFDDPNRKKEVEKLAAMSRDFRQHWDETAAKIVTMIATLHNKKDKRFAAITRQAGKIACEALEKAHEVFVAYREFEGKKKTLTTNPAMKSLEEVLEILGFDPERIYVVAGEDSSYYKKIPKKFKEYIGWLVNLMTIVVDGAICYFQRSIYKIQIFDAVKANDLEKVQYLLKNGGSLIAIDRRDRMALTYAIENGNQKMIRFLLKFGAEVAFPHTVSPILMAIDMGDAKILKLLLEKVKPGDMANFIDLPHKYEGTSLHKAASKGRFDLVKILLSYGATYCLPWILDAERPTPLDVSTNEEVSEFLKIVDECFRDAKDGDVELIHKLKAMENDEFLAIAGTRNLKGETLAVVATMANAENIAVIILRMIEEAKQQEK